MLCQDKVLKENWDFNRGDLYMIDHKKGERPRESTIKVAVILWPEHVSETTKWFMVAPITLDTRGIDPATDVMVRNKKDIGRQYVVNLVHAQMVMERQLLSYVGRLSEQTMNKVISAMQSAPSYYCERKGAKS